MASKKKTDISIMSDTKIRFWQPWFILSLASFFYFYENCLQVSTGVMVPELMRDFAIDAAELGNLAAFYFYAYAGMQIPVGVLIDRFGSKRLLILATSVCAIGCFLFGIATSVFEAEIGRLLIGFGSAFAVVGYLKLAATWFDLHRFALLTGLMLTVGLSGSIVGEAPLAILVAQVGWRNSMLILACIGAILLLLIWRFMQDKPPTQSDKSSSATVLPVRKKLFTGLGVVVSNRQSWFVAIYGGLMFAPTSILALWGVPFIMQAHQLERPEAAGTISMLFLGWIFGSPLLGWVSDRLGKRKPTMWVGSLGAMLLMIIILYSHHLSPLWLSSLLFGIGFFSSGFLPSFSIMREISPHYANATALGFMNMLNMVGGAAGQPLVGLILKAFWTGEMHEGVRIYSTSSYHIALTALPVMMGISLLILPFIRETYCRSIVHSR
jgi:MFS family permease